MSILPNEIATFDYYKKKLPLYLQNSEGFESHFRIWYDILVGSNEFNGIKGSSDTILALLNIFDPEYINYINTLPDSSDNVSDMLDKIGLLYGVKRNFTITYTSAGQTHNETINLDNNDFLIFIKFQIIKNACDGSREIISKFYEDAGLIVYMINQQSSGSVNLYLASRSSISENITKLFLAGLLVLKSMGIGYSYSTVDFDSLLIWDQINSEETNGWGDDVSTGGLWSI